MRMMIGTLFCAALLVAGPVQAEDPTEEEICEAWEGLAGSIMKYRQTGVSISDVMSILPEDAAANEAIRELVAHAFNVPQYEGDEDRAAAEQDFMDQAYMECAIATWHDD